MRIVAGAAFKECEKVAFQRQGAGSLASNNKQVQANLDEEQHFQQLSGSRKRSQKLTRVQDVVEKSYVKILNVRHPT